MEQLRILLDSEITRSLGWTLLHSIWQVGLLAVLVLIVNRLLPGKNAVGKYWVATAGMFSAVVWSVLTFIEQYASFSGTGIPLISNPVAVLSSVMEVSIIELSFTDQLNQFINSNIPLLVSVWVIGLILFSIRLAGGWYYLSQLRNSAAEVKNERLILMVNTISEKLNLRSKVIVAETTEVIAPILVGVFKPMVLFPVAYLAQLSSDETEAVLAHELAHVKRHDYWINILQSVVESFYFFNPFIWWLSTKMREEREHCCDDLAVKLTGRPKIYAETLAAVQEIQISKLAVGFNGRGKLVARVKRLFEPGKRSTLDRSITALLLVALVAGIYWQAREVKLDNLEVPINVASMDISTATNFKNAPEPFTDTIPAPSSKDQDVEVDEIIELPYHNDIELIIEEPLAPGAEVVIIEEIPAELTEIPLPVPLPVEVVEIPEDEMLFEQSLMDMVVIEEIPVAEWSLQMNTWFDSGNDTIPPDMEEIKGMMQQQMNMMEQQQIMMKAEMEKMQMQLEMMQNQVQLKALEESLHVLENMSVEEQKAMKEEQIKRAKAAQKAAQRDMERAIREVEEVRDRHELQARELQKAQKEQFELQQDLVEERMANLKMEMAEIEKAHKAYHEELVKELVNDGYLNSKADNLNINLNNGEMTVNGKKVKSKDKRKYDKLKDKHFKSKE